MANHPIDENHLEKLLRNMPKITDSRNAENIYWSVQTKMNKKTKNKKLIFIPVLSVLAVVIAFILISPVFLQEDHQESKSMDVSSRKDAVVMSAAKQKAQPKKTEKASANINAVQSANDQISKTAIYKEDLGKNNVFTYGVFTKDAVVVPVSVLALKENTDWVTQYKKIAGSLAKKMPSLDNYLPLHGDMKYDAATKKMHIIIEKKDIPSITELFQLNLDSIIQYSFAYQDVKKVDFSDENGNPIEIGELGEVTSKDINKTPHTAFYLYTSGDGEEYLLPTDEKFSNLQAALEAMKTKPDDFHHPVIGQDLSIKVNEENADQATVQFTKNVQLENEKNPMDMIEAILLTAKNFGYSSIQFENIEPLQWNGFDFSKPVEVPLAPNRINIE
ncbi:hypothetical protein AN964_09255 [Heyndrickxia shackletonii]|uniref:Sigma-X negative effector n=1 Tax=Heyndrickxia shackletonii TaxID=157838 RepID=A0A0Q3WXG1_9BACI|nr:GerMN domain-containing protein [Heyndrickxia shackletonii]KQL53669.1 hypothetical protein AN964_09255 [Heyndrickxia shackletonii]NEY99804.1 hypothetical protein [Heyndrickxia shackletonii]